jgi:hypothetical protein
MVNSFAHRIVDGGGEGSHGIPDTKSQIPNTKE